MKKLCNVVMLPTEKAEGYGLLKTNNSTKLEYCGDRYFTQSYLKDTNRTYQHLYLTSDEEIKEGDWYILANVSVVQATESIGNRPNGKKIIATTDKSLTMPYLNSNGMVMEVGGVNQTKQIPQIPESFIKAYVQAQGNIKEVLVEYVDRVREKWVGNNYTHKPTWIEDFQLNLRRDNTCIIHQAKTYSRDEVVKLLDTLRAEMYRDYNSLASIKDYDKWIKNNL